MTDEIDPAVEKRGRLRLIELAEWRAVLSTGQTKNDRR